MAQRSLAFITRLAGLGLLSGLLANPAAALVGGISTASFAQVAGGVQVLPNWVITARHLNPAVGGTYSNGFGSSVIAARYDVASGAFPLDDLTLLRLATPIAAPSLSLVANLLAAGSAYAFDATLTTGGNPAPRGYGFSQVREFLPQVAPDAAGQLPPVSVNLLVTSTGGDGRPYVEDGDSGGGLFLGHVTTLDGDVPLWGITSAFIADTDANGNPSHPRSGFVQLSSYRSWLDNTLATDLTDTQTLTWAVTAVPEPAGALLWLVGGLAGLGGFGVCKRARRGR